MNALDRAELFQKAAAIKCGLLDQTGGDYHEALNEIALTIAELTSSRKEDRERAKRQVRAWKEAGH